MEDTQAINWDVEEEEQPEIPGEYFGCSLEPVGRLRIFSSTHGPETDFPLYLGKNVIGRMPECSVVLPFPSISKQHAVIEILSWSKAPILKDYGSLNGTQILRPPKVLSPGTSHRLRDQELILFGDLPCQYRRLSTPPSLVCRGPLIVEESPRVQGGTQSQGILLAEDSEEEVDSLLERCVAEGPRTTSSPLVTVVPESDEEGPSPAPGGPGPSFTFNLDSDTDEEESRPPAAGESSPATRRGATTETELCKAERVVTESQLLKDQCSVKERDSDIKLERDAKKEVIPKRSPPAGEDSDTDVDDESTSTEKPDSEDLDLQSTQYFLRESHSLEDAVDEPWEILATQPFCPRESEASETQAIADCLEPHGSCSLSRRAAPQDQHPDSPVQAEPLAIESKGLQTLEKDTGHLNCRMPPAKDDQDYPSVSLPPSVPEASGSLQNPLISQNQNHVAPQLPLSPCPPPLEPPIPITRQNGSQEAPEIPLSSELESFHPKVRPRKSSRKTSPPVSSLNLEPHLTAPTDQPVRSESKSQVIRGRARNRSSVKTPEPDVPFLEPQLSTSRGQPVNPKPISRVTRGRTHRSSINTPEPDVPSTSELQPSTSVEQLVICKPVSRVTRGRVHRSSVNTPEPGVSIAAELQSPAPIDQPISPEPVSQVSRGRTHRSSVKTPESVVPIASEIQPSTPTDQSVISGITQGRTHKSVKTPKPVNPTPCELQPSTSTDQLIIPEPTSRATRGRTHRSSVKTPQTCELTSPKLEPSTPTNQPVTPGAIAQRDQSKTLRSSKVSVPVPATPEFQSPEPTPQTNGSRRQKTTRKQTSLTVTISHETYPGPPEPKPRSLRNQKREAMREAKSSRTTSEPAFAQPPELPTHATQIPKVEAPGRSGSTPDSQSTAPQSHKRSSSTVHSPPLQKRLQRGEDHQKKDFINEDKEDTSERPGKKEDIVTSGPGKRKRDQAEEEPKAIPSRSRRRTKSTQDYTTPKVLFTGVVDVRGEKAVLALGGSLASSVEEASHLVTDRVRRTVKFLCALGRGIPILSLDWLHQSRKAGCFLPPDEYIVTDPEQEKNFGFSLRKALSRAREQKLLEGYEIHVTPGVQPPPPQMGEIISCCGGTVLPSMPRSYKPQRVVITCSQDFHRCSVPCRVGLPILSPEFLLTGVLKQEAKPEAFILSTMELSPT
ncbi:mediator of DNA damage checkpoint protein 1 isoform X4 [Erinaceus europaeus]|uniref:Mediator of DNA damage checkpoint protein 1 n=1 Tax=Erinaceus europaeus TaxID=9365 RepID=A0ABM3X982_ERIEU|nr:mediator of DNA damage checkpoint protein 1 isoform X4 [Erinaceus europaeus]